MPCPDLSASCPWVLALSLSTVGEVAVQPPGEPGQPRVVHGYPGLSFSGFPKMSITAPLAIESDFAQLWGTLRLFVTCGPILASWHVFPCRPLPNLDQIKVPR